MRHSALRHVALIVDLAARKLLRNRDDVGLRKMTEASADDRRAVGLDDDDDFLTVEQLAELRQVTPAAVRAQLRAGNLAGQQVLQGQRPVWRIPVSAARRYLEKSGGSSGPAANDVRPSEPETAPRVVAVPVSSTPAAAPGRVEALEAEVRRLRRQLSALAAAHRRLLDAVTTDISGED
jgi:hypothetical protein